MGPGHEQPKVVTNTIFSWFMEIFFSISEVFDHILDIKY